MDAAMNRALRARRFHNWAGTVSTRPTCVHYPATIAEVSRIVRELPAGSSIRPVGAGHSFTPVAAGSQAMMSLDKLTGIVAVDRERKRARFLAGTRLVDASRLLAPFGLALANLGDINVQSLAGAISTSTHGTGIGFTGLAGTVTGLTLIDADGASRDYSSDDDPAALQLVAVSLGALGIIVEVEVRCVDAFDLIAQEGAESLDAVLSDWEECSRAADHFEAFWFPHTDRAMVKRNTRLAPGAPAPEGDPQERGWLRRTVEQEIIGNAAFAGSLALTRAVPALIPQINALSAGAMGAAPYRGASHEVFSAPRRVKFFEMEYSLPLEAGPSAVRELRAEMDRRGWRIPFPLELRSTAADDVALSTSTGRESMYIAVHLPTSMDPEEYFPRCEEILRAAGGRPHWGKMHTLGREDLSSLYPRFDEFCALREALDPHRRFGSEHLQRLFG
ncbi:L-gulonolactone oxidase [Corynebacterium liangguodongii]|uniref:L-gulonolactone oxidase n=3 Tax=Corynebacterium liangguodongii TaxID=2079535 RepID=A0A2S0WFK3_9CORY|nr:L-gulonolactone oxidase [Corynebacterium liangguodongii]PWB98865.1 FAD-binding protein [Corynebacterium liangguodongii]